MKLRYTVGQNQTVYYVDMTSLYPFLNYNLFHQLGHPFIIHKDFEEPQKYFG